jgi:N-acetylated-alpha-linked acidic dipeptidase
MGSGSDFTAFQDFAGIPSIDMGFGFDAKSAVYHYHSNYDSFDWMQRFGDPGFEYHATIAKAWALVAAKLIESPVLPLNATDYSLGMEKYVERVKAKAGDAGFTSQDKDLWATLDKAVAHFKFSASLHDATAAELLYAYFHSDIPWWKPWLKVKLFLQIRNVNTKYKLLERKFLYVEGLDGRAWFKHVVFAPGKWTGYAGATLPGIVEGIEEKSDEVVRKWISIVAAAVDGAAEWLEENA